MNRKRGYHPTGGGLVNHRKDTNHARLYNHNANVIEQTANADGHTATVAIYPVVNRLNQTGAYDVVVNVDGNTVKEWRAPKSAVIPQLQYAGQAVAAKAIQ